MGQYYRIAFRHEGKKRVIVNDRKVEGADYIMAKLMEHSWLGTVFTDAVANEMYQNPTRLAWVGDYADEPHEVEDATHGEVSHAKVWGFYHKHKFKPILFDYTGKWLCNHSKRVCLSFDDYVAKARGEWGIINPIPLLTAIGNNRGGGDYYEGGRDFDKVGTWVWDSISIEDESPEGYEEVDICFKEQE